MDAAVGKGAGGDQLPLIQLGQRRHAVVETVGEHKALHLIVLLDAVVAPGGVQHPVADVHQIQQTPELLLRHFQLHHTTSAHGNLRFHDYSTFQQGLPQKKMGRCANF